MKKTDIIEEYWEVFLQDCHYALVTNGSEKAYERSVAQPTEDNFWAWYMKNKMVQHSEKINNHLSALGHTSHA